MTPKDILTEDGDVLMFGPTISPDRLYNPTQGTYLVVPEDTNTSRLHAQGLTGKGITMAIVDTGVLSDHPLIKKALIKACDFTGEGVEDEVGHGTVVALIALASAPDGSLISAKAIPRSGKGNVKALIEAMRWSAAQGAKVINVSAGIYLPCKLARADDKATLDDPMSCERTTICRTVDELSKQGVMVVAAVGNEPGRCALPAGCLSALALGAVTGQGALASYSGANPDVLALGEPHLQERRL